MQIWNKQLHEIETLAELHAIDIPVVYGDGTKTIEKMLPLDELGKILCEVFGNEN